MTLDPKESVSTDFDIGEVYDISEAGNYTVEFDSRVLDLGTEEPKTLSTRIGTTGNFRTQKVRSNVVEFKLTEDRSAKQSNGVAVGFSEQISTLAKEFNFRSCTTNQQNQLNDVLKVAGKIAKDTQNVLANTGEAQRPHSRRYTEWFGSYTVQNYNKIKDDFDKIVDAIVNRPITFNCSMQDCSESEFAHVFPIRPYEIFL